MVNRYYDEARKDKPPVDRLKVVRLRRQGLSYPVIAERMGISKDRAVEICMEDMSDQERNDILKRFGRDR